MIFSLIVFLLLVVFLAFFVGKNLTNVCTIWFFKTYTDLPVAVLVLIAFGAGIVFSILSIMIFKLKHADARTKKEQEMAEGLLSKAEKKRAKTEAKLKKLQQKKDKDNAKKTPVNPATEGSSDPTIVADKKL